MYRHQYGLKQKPFQISTDPSFLWLGQKHKEALAVLIYGVRNAKGFLLLSGGVGTGKTTLIRALLDQLDNKVTVAIARELVGFIWELARLVDQEQKQRRAA